jgi:hypothetical protein
MLYAINIVKYKCICLKMDITKVETWTSYCDYN